MPRGAGKTRALIDRAAELDQQGRVAYIIVLNRDRAVNVAAMARSLGIHIRFPVTLREVVNARSRNFITDWLFDDLDEILHEFVGRGRVDTVSMTADAP